MRIPLGARGHAGTWALLGVLTAVACLLLAGLPRTMQGSFDEALRESLTTAPAAEADLTVIGEPVLLSGGSLSERAQFEARDQEWRRLLPPALASLVGPAGHMSAKTVRTPVINTSHFINLGWLSDADRRVDWVRGRKPGKPSTMTYDGRTIPLIEVGVVDEAVREMGLRIGQTKVIGDRASAAVKIVGVFEVRDPGDRSWNHDYDIAHVTTFVPQFREKEFHTTALVSDDGLAAIDNGTRPVTYRWILALDGRGASASQAPAAGAAVDDFQRRLVVAGTGGFNYRLVTQLPRLLDDYLAALGAARTIMYLVLGGLLAVALGVIALGVRLLTDRLEPALALTRARGGSLWQVAGAGTALTAAVVAPAALAGYALSFLMPGPVLPMVHLGPAVVVATAVAFAAARLVLSHRTPLHERRDDVAAARPSARRVTLDVLAVVLALAGAYLLRTRGLSGTAEQDPFLLLIPIALTVAVALIIVRGYPYPLRLLVRLTARRRAAVPFLGLTRAARARTASALPVLILLPALSMSVFAAVISDGIAATQRLASWHKVGAPIKLTSDDYIPADVIERVREVAGVERVALALTGRVQMGGTLERPYAVAVDPEQWRQVIGDAPLDLPALPVSTSALLSPALGDRGTFEMMWMSPMRLTTQGVIDSVPGFYSTGQFLVVPWEVLPWPAANTLLISGDPSPAELARLVPSAIVETQEQELAAIEADPLTGTVRSTLLVVTVALGAYALVAIILSLVVGAPGRARAVSLLRTLGLSDRQARRLTVLESLPLILLTALAGLALGLVLPAALGPGVNMSSYAGGRSVGDYTPGLLTPVALACGLAVCAVLGAYAHTAVNRRRNLDAVLRVGDLP